MKQLLLVTAILLINTTKYFRGMSIVICHPHTSASQELGRAALANGYDLVLYMPEQADREWGDHILNDLAILGARGRQNSVGRTAVPNFSQPDIKAVFFPSLGE